MLEKNFVKPFLASQCVQKKFILDTEIAKEAFIPLEYLGFHLMRNFDTFDDEDDEYDEDDEEL